ncbi:MAG: hypothetical protein EKK40_16225 [Bradyrhizobiaceae bacterium]|nr:MAG: hypothetical protein EKK40_16225 [Bradyrhizobiaceae bacterium]
MIVIIEMSPDTGHDPKLAIQETVVHISASVARIRDHDGHVKNGCGQTSLRRGAPESGILVPETLPIMPELTCP